MKYNFDEDTKLVIEFDKGEGRRLEIPYLHKADKVSFEWEEYHSGDTDSYESTSITMNELFELLQMKETQARVLADEVLRKELLSKEAQIEDWKRKDNIRSKEMDKVSRENETLKRSIKIVGQS